MKYDDIVRGKFIERLNRFVAIVEPEDSSIAVKCHVKNTGRCKELLLPGAVVYLEEHLGRMGSRKLAYSLIAVEKKSNTVSPRLINMDSQAPNKATREALEKGRIDLICQEMQHLKSIYPEKPFGESRLDFYLEGKNGKKAFIEVKGVTLENEGVAYFPDAPTERGVRHIKELMAAKEQGYESYVLFVIQMKGVKYFSPNDETHPEFGKVLREAKAKGIHVLAYDSTVRPDSMEIDCSVPVVL